MFSKTFSMLALAYMAVVSTNASPIMSRAYHHDLSGFNGDWYVEATSPAIYEAFEELYKRTGYTCQCLKTNFKADSDSRLDAMASCNLYKDEELVGYGVAVGSLDLSNYNEGLYTFQYNNEEVYYVSDDEPDKKYELSGMYDYMQAEVYYYPVSAHEGDRYIGVLEFNTYEDKTYSTLSTSEYLDDDTLNTMIHELDNYGIDLVNIDAGMCH